MGFVKNDFVVLPGNKQEKWGEVVTRVPFFLLDRMKQGARLLEGSASPLEGVASNKGQPGLQFHHVMSRSHVQHLHSCNVRSMVSEVRRPSRC